MYSGRYSHIQNFNPRLVYTVISYVQRFSELTAIYLELTLIFFLPLDINLTREYDIEYMLKLYTLTQILRNDQKKKKLCF